MSVQLPIHRPGLALLRGPEHTCEDEAGAGSDKPLRVGDLARLTGKTVRALHLYEELQLLEPLERNKGSFRLYAGDSVTRVRFISKLQDLGFSLGDIREIVRSWSASGSAPDAMARMRDLYRAKLEDTRAQVERLRALELELAASLAYLETCDTCDPHRLIAACCSCDKRASDEAAPELVAGLSAH
jgi:DNA-binding transcriptional MerR regulator